MVLPSGRNTLSFTSLKSRAGMEKLSEVLLPSLQHHDRSIKYPTFLSPDLFFFNNYTSTFAISSPLPEFQNYITTYSTSSQHSNHTIMSSRSWCCPFARGPFRPSRRRTAEIHGSFSVQSSSNPTIGAMETSA